MTETSEGQQRIKLEQPNIPSLISERFDINFRNPPTEIPINERNRIKYPNLVEKFAPNTSGQYFFDENTYLFLEDMHPQEEFETKLHENMHGLFHEVNTEYFAMIKSFLDTNLSPTLGIGFLNLFIHGKIDDATYDLAMGNVKSVSDVVNTFVTVNEGIAEWGTFELRSDLEVTADDHKRVIEERGLDYGEDGTMKPYLFGHAFVAGAIEELRQRGITKGDALLRLMLKPPLINEQIKIGGSQYAQQNLI